MAIFKNEDGTEVEALTAEEVEAKLATERASALAEAEKNFNEQKDIIEAEKAELEERIKGIDNKDQNFKVLKEALDKKTDEIKTLGTKIEDEGKKIRSEIVRDDLIEKLSRGNKELEKKIKLNFDETLKGVEAKTPEEIKSKMDSAYKLSIDSTGPNPIDVAINGSGGAGFRPITNNNDKVEISETEKSLGKKFGISEDDYKKYENDPRLKRAVDGN